ncbi:hypothetical protein VPH35_053263 [Triticum aestivum]
MREIILADGVVAAAWRRAARLTSTSPSSTWIRSPLPATMSIWWRAGVTSYHCSRRRQGRHALCHDRMGIPSSVPSSLCSPSLQFLSYLSRFTMSLYSYST